MADRAVTSGQIAVLKSLQACSPERGCLSGHMVAGRRAAWARPKLEALKRRGWATRHPTNVERWHITTAGLAVEIMTPERVKADFIKAAGGIA